MDRPIWEGFYPKLFSDFRALRDLQLLCDHTSDGGVSTSVDFNVTVISECLTFHHWWRYYIHHSHLCIASLARDQSVQVHRMCAQQ